MARAVDAEMMAEAREWVEAVTGTTFEGDGEDGFHETLKTGHVLCALINKIQEGSVKKVNKMKMPFASRENVSNYLKAVRAFGVNEFELFGTDDLFEAKDLQSVVVSLHSLGRKVQEKLPDFTPTLGIKVVAKNERTFSDAQLREANAAVSALNLGSSDHSKAAFVAVLDGTGETDEVKKAEKLATTEARIAEIRAAGAGAGAGDSKEEDA